jgi:hypothetical protein
MMKARVSSLPLIPPFKDIGDLLWVSIEVVIKLILEL